MPKKIEEWVKSIMQKNKGMEKGQAYAIAYSQDQKQKNTPRRNGRRQKKKPQ